MFNEPVFTSDVATLNVLRGGVPDRSEVEFQRPNIVLTLPGDCRLNQQQFDAFEQFKSSPNIRNWSVDAYHATLRAN